MASQPVASPFIAAMALPKRWQVVPARPVFDLSLARLAGLRHLNAQLTAKPRLVAAFWQELAHPHRLADPDVTALYCCLEQGDETFVLMEYIAGETIQDLVQRSEPSRVETAIPFFCQVLDSFEASGGQATAPVADWEDESDEEIRSGDFGVARVASPTRGRLHGTIVFCPDGSLTGEVIGDGGDAADKHEVYRVLATIYKQLPGSRPEGSQVEPAAVEEVVLAPLSREMAQQLAAEPAAEEPRPPAAALAHSAEPPKPAVSVLHRSSGLQVLTQVLIAALTAALIFFAIFGAAGLIARNAGRPSSMALPAFAPLPGESLPEAVPAHKADAHPRAAHRGAERRSKTPIEIPIASLLPPSDAR